MVAQDAHEKADQAVQAIYRRPNPGTTADLDDSAQAWEAKHRADDAYEQAVKAYMECARNAG